MHAMRPARIQDGRDGVTDITKTMKEGTERMETRGDTVYRGVCWAAFACSANTSAVDVKDGKSAIYNAAGQRLSMPQKGLNIINGRKVLIK